MLGLPVAWEFGVLLRSGGTLAGVAGRSIPNSQGFTGGSGTVFHDTAHRPPGVIARHFVEASMGLGRRNGAKIEPAELAKLIEAQEKRGIRIAVDHHGHVVSEQSPAKFRVPVSNEVEPAIFVKPDVTWYEFIHEYHHSLHYRIVGKDV